MYANLSQENLAVLRLFHMSVHAQVDTLIFILSKSSVGVKTSKNTLPLLSIGTINLKGIGSLWYLHLENHQFPQ
ncbi:hypothetical protein MXB_187 [Myxobolus squamalis]|nr:hypothetical protein MXB_187 [Myxobolus squamalis]